MKISHLAVWTRQLELMKDFYCRYFEATPSPRYHNPTKQFTSYFLNFSSGTRLELMHHPDLGGNDPGLRVGLAHFAISLGSESEVDRMTQILRQAGYPTTDGPRRTGDGYYESRIQDPDGNILELTV